MEDSIIGMGMALIVILSLIIKGCIQSKNHKDENKLNNNLNNLEWCNRAYNANYGTGVSRCAKKKWKAVEMINCDGLIVRRFSSAKEAERETSISRKTISMVCLGKRKYAGGYLWRFVYGN